jgi:hypothetical protein
LSSLLAKAVSVGSADRVHDLNARAHREEQPSFADTAPITKGTVPKFVTRSQRRGEGAAGTVSVAALGVLEHSRVGVGKLGPGTDYA